MKHLNLLLNPLLFIIWLSGCSNQSATIEAKVVDISAAVPQSSECDMVDYGYQSFYNPTFRKTFNLHYNVNPCDVKVKGEPLPGPLYIASDLAGSLRRVDKNGTVSTLVYNGYSVNDLELQGSTLHYASMGSTFTMDINTESIIEQNYVKAGMCAKHGLICTDKGVLVAGGINNSFIVEAQYPRDAQRFGSRIYVADTFGHQVIVYDEVEHKVINTIEVYYPNSIQVLNTNTIIVTAEHANSVLQIDLTTNTKTILYGCNEGLYTNAEATVDQIIAYELSGAGTLNERSICLNKLYSPNHATMLSNGDLLIADTDNHRVIVVRNGQVVTEVVGLNNPTRAVLYLDATPAY